MKIEYAKNPQWANSEQTAINLIIKVEGLQEEIPFTASKDDVEPHGIEMFHRAAQGDFGVITEYAPFPPPVPQSVQNRQAKLALLSAGLFKRAEEIINSMEGDAGIAARIEWNATTFSRNSAFLKKIAQTLELSEKQLDDLFILAATYE